MTNAKRLLIIAVNVLHLLEKRKGDRKFIFNTFFSTFLKCEKLQNLTDIFPDLMFLIASQLAIRLRRTSRKVSDLAFTDVKGRVAKTLLDLCSNPDAITHPDGMQISITRQELGRIVGCSREMVGRVLKSLEEDHLISVSGKTMVIF